MDFIAVLGSFDDWRSRREYILVVFAAARGFMSMGQHKWRDQQQVDEKYAHFLLIQMGFNIVCDIVIHILCIVFWCSVFTEYILETFKTLK